MREPRGRASAPLLCVSGGSAGGHSREAEPWGSSGEPGAGAAGGILVPGGWPGAAAWVPARCRPSTSPSARCRSSTRWRARCRPSTPPSARCRSSTARMSGAVLRRHLAAPGVLEWHLAVSAVLRRHPARRDSGRRHPRRSSAGEEHRRRGSAARTRRRRSPAGDRAAEPAEVRRRWPGPAGSGEARGEAGRGVATAGSRTAATGQALPVRAEEIVAAARCSDGTARSAKSWPTRETGPEMEIAIGVGAPGMAMAKQRTPISCSSSSTA